MAASSNVSPSSTPPVIGCQKLSFFGLVFNIKKEYYLLFS
jgi:hypothetical protein